MGFPFPQHVPSSALQLRREKQHLESELERAERESATYVTEVREVRAFVSLVNNSLVMAGRAPTPNHPIFYILFSVHLGQKDAS